MSEQNKALVRSFIDEVFNSRNPAALDRILAEGYVDHSPFPNQPPGREGFKQMIGGFLAAFPDFHATIEDMVAEGDKVVVRVTATGTHQGDFMGIPATGKPFKYQEIHIARIADGKMAEHWGVEDILGMLQQLGVVQPLGQG